MRYKNEHATEIYDCKRTVCFIQKHVYNIESIYKKVSIFKNERVISTLA